MVLDTFAETKVSRRTGAKARIKSEVGYAHPFKEKGLVNFEDYEEPVQD